MQRFANETAQWIESRFGAPEETELELGSLIAAASDWTEDEGELEDVVVGLMETGRFQLAIG